MQHETIGQFVLLHQSIQFSSRNKSATDHKKKQFKTNRGIVQLLKFYQN
jgi:hypothetical protein